MSNHNDLAIKTLSNEADVRRCFGLMQQLRPHLSSAYEFLARWQRQAAQGYRLAGMFDGSTPVATTHELPPE